MATDPTTQAALEQLFRLWIFLQRPVLSRQLLAFGAATLLAWVISGLIWRWLDRRFAWQANVRLGEAGLRSWQRVLFLLNYVTFPVLGFVVAQGTYWLFLGLGWRASLIVDLSPLFQLILIYRLLLALFYMVLGETYMRQYDRYLLTPLFVLFIAERIVSNLVHTSILADFRLWQLFGVSFTLGALLYMGIALYFLLYGSRALQELLEHVVMPRLDADPNIVHVILTVGRYVVIGIAFLIVFQSLGLNLTALAFITGGLSVGIGLSLQGVVANFISGILLLFEQSLRPGDIVRIGDTMGEVKQLSMRATTVRTADNIELIVPNQTLLTSTVTSYTRIDRTIRAWLTIETTWDSEPGKVLDLLLSVAGKHPSVQADPAPI